MFRLVRFFLLTSVIAAVAIAFSVFAYRKDEVQRLIDLAEGQNVALARSLANTIWPRFAPYITSSIPASDRGALPARPETRALHEILNSLTAGLPVLKVQIFNLDGLTIYSTDPPEMGAYRADNPGFRAAREGKSASKLAFRDQISTFEGRVLDRDLVETYLPIRIGNGPIEGVFELYSDVTPLVAGIKAATGNLAIGFVVVFGFLFAILFFVVRAADRTIKRQYADIMDKNAELVEAHNELERRVEERTRKLTKEIAERRRIEDNLHKLSRAVEQSPAMTVITDVDGKIEYVNPRFSQVTGYALEEISGKTPRILKSGEMPAKEYERLWQTIRAGEEWRGEMHNRKKNGELYWALTSISPITSQNGTITHYLGISEDVTQRKRIEEDIRRHRNELAHAGRVIVMGEMATSLAHELNQPLTVISGCAQVCLKKLRASNGKFGEMLDALTQVSEQAQRANEIVRRTRSFIRKEESERRRVDVNRAIHGIADLLRVDAREQDTVLDLTLADKLPAVMADIIQIQQVIINLAHNGAEAMAGGNAQPRRLTIQTAATPDGSIEVSVRDTGPGVPTENRDRIFDPFFTTKPSGLGMGLAISRSIVEAHGGRLWATPNEGPGATFRFTLPGAGEIRSHDR